MNLDEYIKKISTMTRVELEQECVQLWQDLQGYRDIHKAEMEEANRIIYEESAKAKDWQDLYNDERASNQQR